MMNNDLCYIIIVHFNSSLDTKNCIKSIHNSSVDNYKIIIVDNNSTDDSLNDLKGTFTTNRKIFFITTQRNGGYAYGLNFGIKYSLSKKECKYLWLLNNDVLVLKDALKELFISDKSSNAKYLWGNIILNKNNSIQSVGCKINRYFMTTKHNFKNCNYSDENISTNSFDYIHGCSIFLKKDIIKTIGFFNENYFLFYEDVDFCFSAKLNNISLNISKKSKVIHIENATIKKMNYQYLSTLNRVKFAKKYFKNRLPYVYLGIVYEIFKNFMLLRFNRNYLLIKHFLYEVN